MSVSRLSGKVFRAVARRLGYQSPRFDFFASESVADVPTERYSPSYARAKVVETIVPKMGFCATTLSAREWQDQAKEKLQELIGEVEHYAGLNTSALVWTARDKAGTYKKILCTDEWGVPIPMYLCEPFQKRESRGWIICVQGHNSGMHNSIGVDFDQEKFRYDVAKGSEFVKWCFQHGFSALCVEQSCFGARVEKHQTKRSRHPCHDAALGALVLGRTLMGERLSDIKIAIEFLKKLCHDNGEMPNIGIMGNSLGGSLAIYANALIDDLQFAIAGSCVASFEESLLKIYHCADLYIPRIRQFFEFGDILGMSAPKPLVVIQGKQDPIFPISACVSEIESARKVFEAFGAEDHLVLKIGDLGHQFYSKLASEAINELGSRM